MVMDLLEADIDVFQKARKKFSKCKNSETNPHSLGYCKLFHYTMEKGFDFLHHCGSCPANQDDPIISYPVRKR